MYLPDDGSINNTVCRHEVEKVYAAYGIVPLAGISVTNFYGRHIITGLNATPSSVTLAIGATANISVTQLLFANGAFASAPLGSVGLTWGSDAFSIATVNNTGTITAQATGQTTVRAKLIGSSVPSTYQISGVMAQDGQGIAVTVSTAPPPGPGFRVYDITGVPQPITASATYTFRAQVVDGGDPATLQVKWDIWASNQAFDSISTAYGSTSYSLRVPAGSYRIRAYARPRNGTVYGGGYIEDFPVCTGSGGGGNGLAGPDAVGGC
jgi:hypothetical protein